MRLEVWTILTRGKQPSAVHCRTMEKVAEMTAWLPTIAARVAITSTGQNSLPAAANISFSVRRDHHVMYCMKNCD
jgi:hypothetical protein